MLELWIGFWLVASAAAFARNWRHSDALVGDWQNAHGFLLTAEGCARADAQLWSGRRARTIGFVAGLVVPVIVNVIDRSDRSRDWLMLFWVAGYVGADILTMSRQQRGRGAASLDRRRVADYVPMWLIWTLRATPVAIAAVAVVYNAAPRHLALSEQRLFEQKSRLVEVSVTSDVRGWLFQALLIAAVVLASEVLRRWIVQRPQSAVSEEDRAIDDALRSDAVHRVTGCAAFVVLLQANEVLSSMSFNTEVPDLHLLSYAGLVFWFLAAGAIGYTNPLVGWRVRRRTYRTQPSAA